MYILLKRPFYLFYLFIALLFPFLNETKIPRKQRMVKTMKEICMLLRRAGYCSGVIWTRPIIKANMRVAMPMLNVWPMSRIVLTVADATP